jgi:uncharacterized protein YjcR
MAKLKEKEIAKKYYVDHFRAQKEIAEDLGITEKTVSKWVAEGKWKALRDAKMNSSETQTNNLKSLISELTDKALEIREAINIIEAKGKKATEEEKVELLDLKKEATRISQEVAMYNKTLAQFQTGKLPLGVYLEVMEDVFKELQNYDKEVFLKTLDFQRAHLQTIAQKLG